MSNLPSVIESFLEQVTILRPDLPAADLDPADDDAGPWFIDFDLTGLYGQTGASVLTVEWRPQQGFGIFTGDRALFGERPTEVHRHPEFAARRIAQLLSTVHKVGDNADAQSAAPVLQSAWLRELRELHDLSQMEMAARMDVQQAAISRLERRAELKLTSVANYVKALGGTLRIHAHFEECDLPIAIGSESHGAKSATSGVNSGERRKKIEAG